MKTKLILMSAAAGFAMALSSCANMESNSGPFVNQRAIDQGLDTMERASAYESQGSSPGDAWQRARNDNGFDGPFGMMSGGVTPIAGYGWGIGTRGGR